MELWDIYDVHRQKTDKQMVRGEQFEAGCYHAVVHVCIFNTNGQLLIQQRAKHKAGWSGLWDVTVGGSVLAGETSQQGALRELNEELKIQLHEISRPRFTINFENGFDDYYVLIKDIDLSEVRCQSEEVQAVQFADYHQIKQMIYDGLFIPYHSSIIDLIFLMKDQVGAILK